MLADHGDVEQLVANIAAAGDTQAEFEAALGVLARDPTFDPAPALRAVLVDAKRAEYERELTALVLGVGDDPAPRLMSMLTTSSEPTIKYAAFYALNIYYRRLKKLSELSNLISQNAAAFGTHVSFPHLQALNYRVQG